MARFTTGEPKLFNHRFRKIFRYSGEDYLLGIPTRNDLARENDNEGLPAILENTLSKRQDIPFMAIHNEGSSEKINGMYCVSTVLSLMVKRR